MNAEEFRKLALEFPESSEGSHMDHPDFRVGGKIFASLGPDEAWGMVKLAPQDQTLLVTAAPDIFEPFKGAWGRQGSTKVLLKDADKKTVRQALIAAWRNVAPKLLSRKYGDEDL